MNDELRVTKEVPTTPQQGLALANAGPIQAQDILDGVVLRRLRECVGSSRILISALPGDVIVTVGGHLSGTGPTIAEAADRCRKACSR